MVYIMAYISVIIDTIIIFALIYANRKLEKQVKAFMEYNRFLFSQLILTRERYKMLKEKMEE